MHGHESTSLLEPSSSANIFETHQLNSINQLPVEILLNIFLFCSQGLPRKFDSPPRPRCQQAPLLLCQICHYWRELALSLPVLWSSLSGTAGPFTSRPALIELWFSRSRGLPLSLHLAPPSATHHEPRYHSHAAKMLDLFSNEIHRWRAISFTLNNNLADQFIAAVDRSEARKLEEVELIFGIMTTREDVEAKVSSIVPSLNNLRKLSWVGNISATSLRNIPFHQLTHLYMDFPTYEKDVVECLSQSTGAVEIHWKGVRCTDSSSASVYALQQTTLVHLRSLLLLGTGDLALVLSRFTLPSLADLHLHTRVSPSTRDHRMLEDFFDRSSCPLEKFTFFDGTIGQEGISNYLTIPFLESVPSILIFFDHAEALLGKMRDLKDPRYLPMFDRLKVTYPSDACAAFTWK